MCCAPLHRCRAGPDFAELDESLQNAFYNYLAEAGVTDELATTLADYASNKEQQEYVAWLKRISGFVGQGSPALTDGRSR